MVGLIGCWLSGWSRIQRCSATAPKQPTKQPRKISGASDILILIMVGYSPTKLTLAGYSIRNPHVIAGYTPLSLALRDNEVSIVGYDPLLLTTTKMVIIVIVGYDPLLSTTMVYCWI